MCVYCMHVRGPFCFNLVDLCMCTVYTYVDHFGVCVRTNNSTNYYFMTSCLECNDVEFTYDIEVRTYD